MANKKIARKWTEAELIQRIKYRFAGDAYVVVEKVCQGTGAHANSWIDAVSFALWPSKGLYRAAFEVKCARSDFLRELQQPVKNEWARECFHEFWFVAPSNAIKESELPEGVGWMRPHGDTLAIVVHARRKEDPRLDDVFLAAVVRAIQKQFAKDRENDLDKMLLDDPEVKRARAWKAAGEKYLEKMGVHNPGWMYDERKILTALISAKHDDRIKKDREQVLGVLARFQKQTLDLLGLMAAIALNGMLARDEAGDFVVKTWGGDDKGSVESLQRFAKKRSGYYSRNEARDTLKMVRALLAFRTSVEPKGNEA